jgi:hypothetical protein
LKPEGSSAESGEAERGPTTTIHREVHMSTYPLPLLNLRTAPARDAAAPPALAGGNAPGDEHGRQRQRVIASLLACSRLEKPTHRRWA